MKAKNLTHLETAALIAFEAPDYQVQKYPRSGASVKDSLDFYEQSLALLSAMLRLEAKSQLFSEGERARAAATHKYLSRCVEQTARGKKKLASKPLYPAQSIYRMVVTLSRFYRRSKEGAPASGLSSRPASDVRQGAKS